MSADWVATFSLGILARSQTSTSANPNLIPVFWAPILLLHLGGPETITAYSLADNELWTRRLLELVIQAGVASYVLYKLWSRNAIIFVAIPIFVSGIIKYGERIRAFMIATSVNFSAAYQSSAPRRPCLPFEDLYSINDSSREVRSFHEARLLYRTVQILSKNLPLVHLDQEISYELVSEKKAEEAFGLTEIELGFMYYRLYSKVTEISSLRIILHSISCLSSISALISFSIMTMSKNVYSKNDTMLSYLLLVGAVLLDCYSITVFFLSDWGMIWLSKKKYIIVCRNYCLSPLLAFFRKRKRWSSSMGQHNLISAQTKKPMSKLLKHFMRKWKIPSPVSVNKDLKALIFQQVMDKRSRYDPDTNDFLVLLELLEERGIKNGFANHQNCAMSRSLSNYMLYLLVHCPAMLAIELSGTRNTYNKEAETNISKYKLVTLSFPKAEVKAVFHELLQSPSTMLTEIKEQEEEKSALLDGCMLALSLQSLDGWANEKKWEMISEVWVEMLMYAASHCGWKEHADALARGGELLTHCIAHQDELTAAKISLIRVRGAPHAPPEDPVTVSHVHPRAPEVDDECRPRAPYLSRAEPFTPSQAEPRSSRQRKAPLKISEQVNYVEKDDREETAFLVQQGHDEKHENIWYLDTGASNHMYGHRELFGDPDETKQAIVIAFLLAISMYSSSSIIERTIQA
ncbi:uncharacterized protein [Populus alba]|uniref:uncharacterized protein n=1 Tax=Populus alba TaxID=43335 RepID=UPI003CC73D9D